MKVMDFKSLFAGILAGAVLCVASSLKAQDGKDAQPAGLKVHPMFSSNMVLQRDLPLKIWGAAAAGDEITVKFAGQAKTAKADAKGKWTAMLDAVTASSEPGTLTVSSKKEGSSAKFENVVVGDVWICSGQSNMEWSVSNSNDAQKEIAEATYPNIRLFTVGKKISGKPETALSGSWLVCTPQSIHPFSAVGYFFGRDLQKKLNVPIGLINTSWGGTPAEAWTSIGTLEANPELSPMVRRFNETAARHPKKLKEHDRQLEEWKKGVNGKVENDRYVDEGNKGFEMGWAKPDFDASDWKEMDLPALWETVMNIDGSVWFRKEVEIPAGWAGKPLKLALGSIDDLDTAYFNGVEIGKTGKGTENYWQFHRNYIVPGELVKTGKAVVAVRVFDEFGGGGFSGAKNTMLISSNDQEIGLAGPWKYKAEKALNPIAKPNLPEAENQNSPARLFNGMINPIIPYGIKGAIWYQGESNAGRAYQYRKLLPAMISDWRKSWNQPPPGTDFPFLIVQLANFMAPPVRPADSSWAELREAQAMAATSVKSAGLAVAIDIGDEKDIHPRNKQEVGRRLALAALKTAYAQDVVFSGPAYDSMKVDGNKIILSFKNIGSGLVAKDGVLKQFAIAGADKTFVWANAKIEGETVVVWSDHVKNPVAVRYAWADNPEGCNLCNKEGLPAIPFRTDDWQGSTFGKF